ncbi:MAG: bifunctional methylenetetrahydrofolate dehydrogenase/methenyltetrahydrofolate cyclohydrolase FolD [Erysipelotrichaceae bacterium]
MMNIVYGSELSKELRENLKKEIEKTEGRKPCLAVVLVGENPASLSYVKGKNKALHEVGMECRQIDLKEDIKEEELLGLIAELNSDDKIDGILVQLPLPEHIDQKKVIQSIVPDKDVDGLNVINAGKLFTGEDGFVPCTPLGVIKLLERMNCNVEGKEVTVIGRSNLVGLPVARLLTRKNATVTICHSKTHNLKDVCKRADILVVAMGKPKFITSEYVKEGAYVIDVGVNRVDGKLCGDVDFENVKDKCAAITPVPKGVGPMTITMLLHNTLKAYKLHEGIK